MRIECDRKACHYTGHIFITVNNPTTVVVWFSSDGFGHIHIEDTVVEVL